MRTQLPLFRLAQIAAIAVMLVTVDAGLFAALYHMLH